MSSVPQGLITRLRNASGNGKMRFSVVQGQGFVAANSEEAIRLLCDIWNHREFIASELEKLPDTVLVSYKQDSR